MGARLLLLTTFLLPFAELWEQTLGIETQLKPYRLAAIVGIVLVLGRALLKRQFRTDFLQRSVLLIFLWSLSAGLFRFLLGAEVDLAGMISDSLLIVFGFLFGLSVLQVAKTTEDIRTFQYAFVIGLVLSLILYFFFGVPAYGRLSAFYPNPNSLGFASVVGICILLTEILHRKDLSLLKNLAVIISLILLLYTLLECGSRSGLAAGSLAISICAIRYARRRLIFLLVVGMALGVGFVKYVRPAVSETSIARMAPENWKNATGRRDLWMAAIEIAADHQLLGAGVAQVRSHSAAAINSFDNVAEAGLRGKQGKGLGSHSEYLNQLAVGGLPALLLFLVAIAIVYIRVWKIRTMDDRQYAVVTSILASLTALYVAQIAAVFMLSPEFYLTMALAGASIKFFQTETGKSQRNRFPRSRSY